MSFPRPEGHHVITPGASVRNAAAVLEFVVGHAEIRIGDSVVMFGDPMPGDDPMPASLSFYVDDAAAVDATYQRALDAGAVSLAAPSDQLYGYRAATVRDAGGNRWTICAIVEQLTPQEIEQRFAAMGDGG